MATKYVWSGASGANDGSSWTDAWTSIASATGVAAGDEIRVHDAHDEFGASLTLTFTNGTPANPVKIVCVDKNNGDALSTGAQIGGNNNGTSIYNLYVKGNHYARGITWRSSQDLMIGDNVGILYANVITHEYCTYKTQLPNGGYSGEHQAVCFGPVPYVGGEYRILNCTFDFTVAYSNSNAIAFGGRKTLLSGCTLIAAQSPCFKMTISNYSAGVVEIEDMDLSGSQKLVLPRGG